MLLEMILCKIHGHSGTLLKYDEKTRQWEKTTLPTHCHFIGKFKNDKPTGFGVLLIAPPPYGFTITYTGLWKEGRFHGLGTYKTVNSSHSSQYYGQFIDGYKHGFGVESDLGGTYKGLWKKDEHCGKKSFDFFMEG